MSTNDSELLLHLKDDKWPLEYIDHDRQIARAIVFDEDGYFYFVGIDRDDDFGNCAYIETAGGGVEDGEDLLTAIEREAAEELGARVEVVCKIGVVEDYYNLIHRHNINNYFLCKVISFGDRSLTQDEIDKWHLSIIKLTYEQAINEYEKGATTRLGSLVAKREMPVLKQAKIILESRGVNFDA